MEELTVDGQPMRNVRETDPQYWNQNHISHVMNQYGFMNISEMEVLLRTNLKDLDMIKIYASCFRFRFFKMENTNRYGWLYLLLQFVLGFVPLFLVWKYPTKFHIWIVVTILQILTMLIASIGTANLPVVMNGFSLFISYILDILYFYPWIGLYHGYLVYIINLLISGPGIIILVQRWWFYCNCFCGGIENGIVESWMVRSGVLKIHKSKLTRLGNIYMPV